MDGTVNLAVREEGREVSDTTLLETGADALADGAGVAAFAAVLAAVFSAVFSVDLLLGTLEG